MSSVSTSKRAKRKKPEWLEIVQRYQKPQVFKSVYQMVNSFLPFAITWFLMYKSLSYSYWLTLLLAFVAAGFQIRIFIIQHDCGHMSFFKSRKANDMLGAVCGVLTLTPYHHWRTQHARHHATSGDLDFRGFGDVETITVNEYLERNWLGRAKYRFYRHPLVLFVFTPSLLFIFAHRVPLNTNKAEKRARASAYWTDVSILAAILVMGVWVGFGEFFMIQLPITIIASSAGVYLFYVQHQFEDTYWRYHKQWDYENAALKGSSYFKLPKLLQWFSGNIGFHHVHHLSPLIPNYLLEKTHEENPLFQDVETLTIKSSIRSIFLHLWDENSDKLVSFRQLRKLKLQM